MIDNDNTEVESKIVESPTSEIVILVSEYNVKQYKVRQYSGGNCRAARSR